MNYRNSSSLVSGRTEYGGPGNTVLRVGGTRTAGSRPYRRVILSEAKNPYPVSMGRVLRNGSVGTADGKMPSLQAEDADGRVPSLRAGGRRTAKLRHYRRNGSLPRAARWPGVRLPYELRAELLPKTDELSVILCIS